MTSVYLIPYHSQPRHLNGAVGHFALVEQAIVKGEWPYDNGDDPSFYVSRRRGPLTWGVCRQDIRNSIKVGSIVVFFSFTMHLDKTVTYRLSAVATVYEKIDRRVVYDDSRFDGYTGSYLNILIRPDHTQWRYDENDRPPRDRHGDWLWRIADHEKKKRPVFDSTYHKIYKTGLLDHEVKIAKNYIVFATEPNDTYICPNPPEVATAMRGQHEKWSHSELYRLTVGRAGRGYLRTTNRSGRNIHPEIRFTMLEDEAAAWRQALISVLKAG